MLKVANSVINASQITGVLPVVNGGTGVTTSTGTGNTVLSAAPTLSGNVTLSTGNLIVASGQGIDFSATPGTGTSELLADYEEGTWTPTDISGASLAITTTGTPSYVKVGKICTLTAYITWPITASVADVIIGGLPFTPAAIGNTQGGSPHDTSFATAFMIFIVTSVPGIVFPKFGGTSITNVELSAKYIRFRCTYITT
jgi:hypothetical protein